MKAIVYTTNAGSSERYAKMLSDRAEIPAMTLAEAKKRLAKGDEVICIGWVMANSVKGYRDAAKRFTVRAVCAVGMCPAGTMDAAIRQANGIPENIPLFTLEGNLRPGELHGLYKILIGMMLHGLEGNRKRSADEEKLLGLMTGGEDRVRSGMLDGVIEWFENNK